MHIRGKVGLVDNQYVRLRDAWAVFSRNLVARSYIDYIDKEIHQCRTEGQGEVIASRFYQYNVRIGESGLYFAARIRKHAMYLPELLMQHPKS